MRTFWLWTILPFSLFVKHPDFDLVLASAKKWNSGMQGGSSGINYKLVVVPNKPGKKLKFDYLLVKGDTIQLRANSQGKLDRATDFKKGDTLFLTASSVFPPTHRMEKGSEKQENTENYLIYHKRKKQKEFVIEKFEVKKGKPGIK